MSQQISVTLTDEEYAALVQEAAAQGQPVADLVRAVVQEQLRPRRTTADQRPAIDQVLYERGVIAALPTRNPESPTEAREREQLAALFAHGAAVSDNVIEERGPR